MIITSIGLSPDCRYVVGAFRINCHTANRTWSAQFTFHVRGDHGATLVFYLNFSASCFITFSMSMASNGTGPQLNSGMLKLFRQSS